MKKKKGRERERGGRKREKMVGGMRGKMRKREKEREEEKQQQGKNRERE